MNTDMLEFLGEFKKWLESSPEKNFDYGDFYVSAVTVSFESEEMGTFKPEGGKADNMPWIYEEVKNV